jgi:peptidyl-prolyl cis-trans isomerase D
MAAIGSIRKHSTLLVIVIGVALAAFILGDFAKRRNKRDLNVGVVDGEEITIMDFNNRYEHYLENVKQRNQSNRVSEQEQASVKEQTWNKMVEEIILDNEFKELGIDVTTDELADMIQGPNPDPEIVRSFTDPNTGKFDRSSVISFIQNIDTYPPDVQQRWQLFKAFLIEKRETEKFNNLISKGYYIPKALAMKSYNDLYDVADVDFVAKKLEEISDSTVVVNDEDYLAYYDAHKESFKTKPVRDLEYVVFNVTPSAKDINKAKKDVEILTKELKSIKKEDVPRFITVNSDVPYDSSWKSKGSLPVEIDSIMFVEKPGFVSNYWFSNNTYYVARLMDKAERPDSLKATHILIAYQGAYRADQSVTRTREQAAQLADSLLNVIKKSPNKIEAVAKEYSNDPSAQRNNGDLGWFKDGTMVPAFNEGVINHNIGDVFVVETQFGYHIVKVTGKKDFSPKVRVAELVYQVIPSNETYQNIFAKASKLASETQNEEQFAEKAKEMGVQIMTQPNIHEMTTSIRNFYNVRPVVRWSFSDQTDVGQVSDVFDLDGAYMVAVVTKKMDEGYPTLSEIKPQIEKKVIDIKKGEYIADEMKKAGNNLNDIADKLGLKIENDKKLSFLGRSIGDYPRQLKAIGTSFGLDENEVSKPVPDNMAVFVIKLNRLKVADAEKNYEQVIKRKEQEIESAVKNKQVYNALKKVSTIEDNRIKFF